MRERIGQAPGSQDLKNQDRGHAPDSKGGKQRKQP